MEDVTRRETDWVFSPTLDFWAHTAPVLAGLLVAPYLVSRVDGDTLPLWGYLVVVVFCDVGHVWGTIFRCYMDTAENTRRWVLYNLSPVAIFALLFYLHYVLSEGLCWMFIGYFALFHFIRQQWGLLSLYRARRGEKNDGTLDRVTHWIGAVGPIAVWHGDPYRSFDWFMREDPFLIRLPSASRYYVFAVWLATLVYYGVHQYRLGKEANVGKCLTMAYCWFTWAVGVLFPHKLVAVFFLNMFHAAPSYMIVFFTSRNKWLQEDPPSDAERFVQWATEKGHYVWYLVFFVAIAVVEEALWEALVWRDYFPELFAFELTPLGRSLASALLTLPQVTHYFLDAFIWRLDSNPGLAEYYGLACSRKPKNLARA